jgi:hypothetical protein
VRTAGARAWVQGGLGRPAVVTAQSIPATPRVFNARHS